MTGFLQTSNKAFIITDGSLRVWSWAIRCVIDFWTGRMLKQMRSFCWSGIWSNSFSKKLRSLKMRSITSQSSSTKDFSAKKRLFLVSLSNANYSFDTLFIKRYQFTARLMKALSYAGDSLFSRSLSNSSAILAAAWMYSLLMLMMR